MIQNAIDSITNFLLTDVKNKKETKETAVLIRIICCIFILYYFIIGVTLAFLQHYYISLMLIAAIGFLVGSFICTYEDHTTAGLVTLNLVLLLFSTILCLYVGFSMDFHIAIFLNILLIYYNKSDRMRFKWFYSIFLCIYLMLLAQFHEGLALARIPDSGAKVFLQILNILVIGCSIGSIAYFYCTKFNQAEEKLKKINENLERMANLDALTGLSNRRHMNEHMAGLVYEYNRSGKTFTIAIGDVDFFKKVNDTYGHDTGDHVLSTLASLFSKYMKGKGHVARWGGEEFLFAFENMNIEKAYQQLDALRQEIEAMPVQFKEYNFQISMTFGMEEFNNRLGIEATINRADEKLYKGKTSGRNQVVI